MAGKPLLELAGINKRLDGVAELKDLFMTRSEIREILNEFMTLNAYRKDIFGM